MRTATRPRSSTKGPLDLDDPRSTEIAPKFSNPLDAPRSRPDATAATSAARPAQRSSSPHIAPGYGLMSPQYANPQSKSPGPGHASPMEKTASKWRQVSTTPQPTTRAKDFSYLLRPEIYHPLPATAAAATNVPQPFRDAVGRQPDPEATVGIADDVSGTLLADLLAAGHFRAAAIVAARQLVATPDPTDHARIFALLYTRLACLLLLDATAMATQEAKALEDLNNPFYRSDPAPGADNKTNPPPHLVPWELRVLHVRLQALGFGDPRRAVMSYYELAREARLRIAAALTAHDNVAHEQWKMRLAELGMQVTGALIEMDDLAGAAAHLANVSGDLPDSTSTAATSPASRRIAMARALLWLQLGEVDEARAAMGGHDEPDSSKTLPPDDTRDSSKHGSGDLAARVVAALCDMADGEYKKALVSWRELHDDAPDDEMIGVNLAVCLLYVGQMQDGRALLEQMVDAGASSHTLLFNLSTMYELCTDRAKTLKLSLAQRVADQTPKEGQSWEKTNADFKL
ncbi:hypothetical protein SEPCBS119000_004873 [Sporothrix epigloea]|uniref:Tetratricopeptide repeat protein 15 n=1 Tax=Sporothrix epigloea TaxID=1892477 RepID=A0ABP0DUT5_9PEZI